MEQISLAKNRVTRHYVKDISFGNIPKSAMLSIFSNGRILGNLIEFEIRATFKGFLGRMMLGLMMVLPI